MAQAFKTISAKPTFGTLQENLSQSDYINRKKSINLFLKKQSIYKDNKVTPSYDIINSVNLGFRLNTLNSFYNNKNNLISSQHTKENLKNVCTVSYNDFAPLGEEKYCQDDIPIIIEPGSASSAFYNDYIIDPLGQLFGKSQCGELNYTEYNTLDYC